MGGPGKQICVSLQHWLPHSRPIGHTHLLSTHARFVTAGLQSAGTQHDSGPSAMHLPLLHSLVIGGQTQRLLSLQTWLLPAGHWSFVQH